MKKRIKDKGFTLIEIISVVIVLGILLIIAIPAVSKNIMDSRDSSYVASIKKYIEAARNEVTGYEYIVNDPDTTYYIPTKCLAVENGEKSPYGNMEESYVVVITEKDGTHKYYYVGRDDTNHGMSLTSSDQLDEDNLKSNISKVETNQNIDGREKIVVYSLTCDKNQSTSYGNTETVVCGKTTGESTVWTTENRTITVECQGNCKNRTYTKTFDRTTKVGIIKIESNNGKKVDCRVNVYVDKGDKAAEIKAIKRISGREVADGVLSNEGLDFIITKTDNGPSGTSLYYCKDIVDSCEPNQLVTSGRTITKYDDVEGLFYIRYKAKGGNGSESDTYSYTARVDTVRPTVTVTGIKKTSQTEVESEDWSNEGLNFRFNVVKGGIGETEVFYCQDTTNTCDPSD